VRKKIDEYAVAGKARQAQRVRELDAAVERRKKEKFAKIDELRRKCEAEIASRPATATDGEGPRKERKWFEIEKEKLGVARQCTTTRIEAIVAEMEKALAKFNRELSVINKLRRQLQRRIETETRAINDEYERKI
jgi:hypothetical protein